LSGLILLNSMLLLFSINSGNM